MKFEFEEKIVLIGAKENAGKDGNVYYNASFEMNDDVETLSCTREVYDAFASGRVKKYTENVAALTFDTRYGKARLVGIKPVAK